MKIQDEIRYDASPDAVAAMLADPAFVADKCARTGALDHTVDVSGEASGPFTVTTERTMPTNDFPDVAKKFVGDTIVIQEVDTWEAAAPDGSRRGTIVLRIKGAPLVLNGTLGLRADGAATVESVDGDLKASVPLVGGKLEKAAEPAVRAAMRKEHEVGREYLAR
jgi:hypothetical protein